MSNTEGDDQQKPTRSRRWIWIALAPVLIFAGAYLAEQGVGPMTDAERLRDMVNAMGGRLAEADRESAARIEAQQRDSPLGNYGPEQAMDATTRSATRAWAAAGIGIIDESLAKREKILQESIARIETSRASDKVKGALLKAIRDAEPNKASLSVRIMKAMRAYLAKIAEMVAYLDLNAQAIQLRKGQFEFDDSAAGERYNKLEHELAALERELRGLLQQQRRK